MTPKLSRSSLMGPNCGALQHMDYTKDSGQESREHRMCWDISVLICGGEIPSPYFCLGVLIPLLQLNCLLAASAIFLTITIINKRR